MPRAKKLELRFPIKLTMSQRRRLVEAAPGLARRLKLDEPNLRIVDFSVTELNSIKTKIETALKKAASRTQQRPLWGVLQAVEEALAESQNLSPAQTVYQFKITLLESHPPIWRRIQVQGCPLDKLHEHIQTAMGWTDSHMNQFLIGERYFSDPELMGEDFAELKHADSRDTTISQILPKVAAGFRFGYEYDFGDSWEHEVLLEGIVRAETKVKYPRCLDGARACPPEDCGGVWGYADFLKAIRDPGCAEHEEMLEWIGGYFDPEAFDPAKATRAMRKGLPQSRCPF